MGRHKDGVSPVGYPPVVRLIPASPRFGRLAGIGSSTGGYWFFDWRVLVLRLAGFGLATGGFWVGDWALCLQGRFLFGKTKIAALSANLSYNLRLLKNLGDG